MDDLLIVSRDDNLCDQLERRLSDCYAFDRRADISAAQPSIDTGKASVLLIDCPARDDQVREFLQYNELTHPYLECTVMIEPESFRALALSKSHNLYILLKPVEIEDVAKVLRETKTKLTRETIFPNKNDPYFLRQQEQRFWHTLIHSDTAAIGTGCEAPFNYGIEFEDKQPVLPVLFCFRGWRRQPTGAREREILRFGLRAYLEQILPRQYGGVALDPETDNCLVLLYGGELPGAGALDGICRNVVRTARRGLYCDVACYCGEPCNVLEVAAQVRKLTAWDRNNVVDNQGVFFLTQLIQKRPSLSSPMPQDWMLYFTQGSLDGFCRCVDEFFQQALAENTLDRDFLTCFQQDMVQELGFALKNAGVPARRLFRGSAGEEEMRDAVRSVSAMQAWIRRVAGEAITLAGINSETPDIVQTVLQCIQASIERPLPRAELSKLLHLSQNHIARVFRQGMGMSISKYITLQRVDMACRMLVQSELPLTTVAERCGFSDYSYFYKTLKKATGLSPGEYRSQMRN